MISLSGVLRRPCLDDAPWVPHDEGATEEEAIAAITRQMQYDALRVDLLDDRTGPINFVGGPPCARGNFTICSGRFEINPLSSAGLRALAQAFEEHRKTTHFRLALELERMHERQRRELDALPRQDRYAYTYRAAQRVVRDRWWDKMRPISARLEAIYKTGVSSC